MVFRNMFHRRNGSPWETVGHWEIAPVSIYDSEHAGPDPFLWCHGHGYL
jgi:hypothetical protein